MLPRVMAIIGVLVVVFPAAASIIIDRASGSPAGAIGDLQYVSWTQSSTFTNVSVSATLVNANPVVVTVPPPATGTAYLMNQVGPGTTSANEVTSPFSLSVPSTTLSSISLFSGLTLNSGTYFLVISPNDLYLAWGYDGSAVTTTAGGVTANRDGFRNGPPALYPPATGFSQKGQQLLFSVTGDSGQIPEPATAGLVLAALCGLALWRRRR